MLKYGIKYIAVMAFVVFLQSCIKDDYQGPDPNLPTRTVLAYLGGDNSLSATLKSEVEELRRGWTYTGNRCLIYVDPVDDVPRLLSLRGGCSTYPTPFIDTLATYSEENSASAEVFRRVIDDVVRLQPADSYGLIFSSHASGWLPEGTLGNPTRSIGVDNTGGTMATTNTEMELADFAAAIPDGQFDFIIFEACLMSGVEVAYELRNKTDYILASSAELIVPGFMSIYRSSLRYLFNTGQTTESALTAFASTYYNYVNGLSEPYRSTTLSILKTENINLLASRTEEVFATRAFEGISDINTLQRFDRPGSYGDRPALPRYFDFMECVDKIATPAEYAEIESAMNDIVVWKAATPTFMTGYNGFAITRHSGLTTYIEQPAFDKLNASYRLTAWWRATH